MKHRCGRGALLTPASRFWWAERCRPPARPRDKRLLILHAAREANAIRSCLPPPLLTAVAAVGTGDELLWPLVAVLLLGPQAEAADGDGLRHRLEGQGGVGIGGERGREGERKSRVSVGFNGIKCRCRTSVWVHVCVRVTSLRWAESCRLPSAEALSR